MRLVRLSEALQIILRRLSPICEIEEVPIRDALGRVLAEDVVSDVDIPPYNRAAMDGFAVRSEDVAGASVECPIRLRIVGCSEIGKPFADGVSPSTAVRIDTGAVMPDGSDAVVKLEDSRQEGEYVLIYRPVAKLENVSLQGEDVKKGEVVLPKGTLIKPFDIAMLKAIGVDKVRVYRRLRAAVFAVGDELTDDIPKSPGQLREYTREIAIGLLKLWGVKVDDFGIVGDDEEEISSKLNEALGYDVIVTVGGTSVGKKDLMPRVIAKEGELLVNGVAVQPGKPFSFGIINGRPIACLPGLPVAAYVDSILILRRIIEALSGLSEELALPTKTARLAKHIWSKPGWVTAARVRLVDGEAHPILVSGSGILSSLVRADGIVLVPEDLEGLEAGRVVEVILTRWVANV